MNPTTPGPTARIVIEYCPRCGWLLRSAWLAQELLTTFASELSELTLKPAPSGTFKIWANQTLVWDRATNEGFPQAAELKRLVAPLIAPGKDLGHSDKGHGSNATTDQ
jgi:selenoprotein W-related protein